MSEENSSITEIQKMKESFEKFVTDSEMGLQVQPFQLEKFKEWTQDLEEIIDNGYSYEDGVRDGREEVRHALRATIRDISTDIDNLKEKLEELEAECDLDPDEEPS